MSVTSGADQELTEPDDPSGPLLELLLFGDDGRIERAVQHHLAEAGYRVRRLDQLDELITELRSGGGDAILLAVQELEAPVRDVRSIRAVTPKPILIFHTPDSPHRTLDLLEVGADDLICTNVEEDRPVALRELRIRLASALRLCAARVRPMDGPVLVVADVTLHTDARLVYRGERPVELTRIEFQLLHRLVAAEERVVPYEELLRGVWSENQTDQLGYLRVYMTRLRKRLGWTGSVGPRIRSVRGQGYRLELPQNDVSDQAEASQR